MSSSRSALSEFDDFLRQPTVKPSSAPLLNVASILQEPKNPVRDDWSSTTSGRAESVAQAVAKVIDKTPLKTPNDIFGGLSVKFSANTNVDPREEVFDDLSDDTSSYFWRMVVAESALPYAELFEEYIQTEKERIELEDGKRKVPAKGDPLQSREFTYSRSPKTKAINGMEAALVELRSINLWPTAQLSPSDRKRMITHLQHSDLTAQPLARLVGLCIQRSYSAKRQIAFNSLEANLPIQISNQLTKFQGMSWNSDFTAVTYQPKPAYQRRAERKSIKLADL